MSPQKHPRKRLFVDPKVQGALVARVVLYWIVFLITVALMLFCWRIFTGPVLPFSVHFDEIWYRYGPAMLASLLLLPLVAVDIVRLSNQFVGPLLRLRRSMRRLGRGEHVDPIEFRDTDFWQDFADEFNIVAARIEELAPPGDQEESDEAEPVAVG